MMVEHIVLFKWNEDAEPDAVQAACDGLKALRFKIMGIVDLSIGPNFSERNKGYDTGLVVRFQDRESLDAYGPHPEHQHVVQNLLAPIRADVLAVDYDIE